MSTLEWIDAGDKGKWLAVREEHVRYSEPIKQVVFYPVYRATESEARDTYNLGTELQGWGEGRYTFTTVGGRQISVHLLHGGKTLPVYTEEHPIPCPKVRVGTETRWNGSYWQKWTKTKGWVVA